MALVVWAGSAVAGVDRDRVLTLLGRLEQYLDDLREKQDEVKSREREYRDLFNGTSHGLIQVDSSGTIERVNDPALEMFGYEREELVGKDVNILVPDGQSELHREHLDHYMESPETREMGEGRDLSAVKKDGTTFPVEIGLNPLSTDGKPRIIADITDISARREAEQAVRVERAALSRLVVRINGLL
ncbi:MAG: PAS domain S-box protein, partial [bacterium]